jgi:DNA-binding MarR family transcriptional regulator
MSTAELSSRFTKTEGGFGPPLIGALLRLPWQALRRRQLEGVHARGFADLHDAHLTVFAWPGPQGLRPAELADRCGMSRQALNHLLGQLERAGYLRRRPDERIGRATRIELTARGEALGYALREIVTQVEQEWAEAVGADRFEELRGRLAELAAAVASERPDRTRRS